MNYEENHKKKIISLLLLKKKLLLQELKSKTEKKSVQRQIVVRACFMKRATHGFYHTAFKEMVLADECHFKEFLRMSPQKFNELVRIVGAKIFKRNEEHHGAISVEERLCLSLRYAFHL